MSGRDAVAVTGIGLVSPLGCGWRESFEAMCEARSAIAPIRGFEPNGLATRFAGEAPADFEEAYAARVVLPFPRRHARFTRMALLAGALAIEDSGIELEREDLRRFGVSLGVGGSSFHYLLAVSEGMRAGEPRLESLIDHNYAVKYMPNAATAQLCMWKGLEGPSSTHCVACASGAQAIAQAVDWIRDGRADVVLAGGADATVDRFTLSAYNRIRALSTRNDDPARASRPFDRDRDGFVMAEGACVLVLESQAHARARSASIFARVLGHASTNEAHKLVSPRRDGSGIARTIRLALADARLPVDAVEYINAHGTSTRLNDAAETEGIKRALGEHAHRIPVTSHKSMIGHAIGASSAIAAAVTALTLQRGVVTPTINLEEPSEDCDLDYVPREAREQPVGHGLVNAFGFGGHNCCLVLGRA